MYAATAIRSGLTVDLLDDTYWWGRGSDPLWRYAFWTAVIYIRSCSDLATLSISTLVDQIAERLKL